MVLFGHHGSVAALLVAILQQASANGDGVESVSHEIMDAADVDKDGQLSLTEVRDLLESELGNEPEGTTPAFAAEVKSHHAAISNVLEHSFRESDRNGDGFLSLKELEEFDIAMREHVSKITRPEL
eukprot:TRINITY_DN4887_c0_g1_i1.p1 TRINITY_DN4887_c0_g1~~TRINITY_DN4887_c0_g1_i1.p1  ORF type:complete len:126 (+),score=24.02 TRINITY_DN4887_c0_g1_i1:93-470(+)